MRLMCENCDNIIDTDCTARCDNCAWLIPWYIPYLYIVDLNPAALRKVHHLKEPPLGNIYLLVTAQTDVPKHEKIISIKVQLDYMGYKRERAIAANKKRKRCISLSPQILQELDGICLFREDIYDIVLRSIDDEGVL